MDPVEQTGREASFFGHPRGLYTLFATEMWERFSFYGMRAILILFMTASIETGGLGFDVKVAGAVYGTYVALAYMLALPGGWVADKLLGLRRAVLIGGILIMCGQLCLTYPDRVLFYPGLGLIVLGTGLLKPNVSAIVGDLYADEDVRRDAGFSIFYIGINLGAFIAPLVVGWMAQGEGFKGFLIRAGISPTSSWHWGFGVGAAGMLIGLLQYVMGWKHLGTAGDHPGVAPESVEGRKARRRFGAGVLLLLVLLGAMVLAADRWMLSIVSVANAINWLYVLVVVIFFIALFRMDTWTGEERKRLYVILLLFIGSAVFWSAFEQAASTLNLFAADNTRNSIFNWTFPSSWLQSVNALAIIALAPAFAWFWVRMGKRDPSSSAKFATGLFFVSLGFVVMVCGASAAANGVRVSPMWLVTTYILHTIGELCLCPVGLSSITRLAPDRVKGMMMGVWFLAASIGNMIAGRVAGFYASFSLPQLFGAVAVFALVASALMFALIGPIRHMIARNPASVAQH